MAEFKSSDVKKVGRVEISARRLKELAEKLEKVRETDANVEVDLYLVPNEDNRASQIAFDFSAEAKKEEKEEVKKEDEPKKEDDKPTEEEPKKKEEPVKKEDAPKVEEKTEKTIVKEPKAEEKPVETPAEEPKVEEKPTEVPAEAPKTKEKAKLPDGVIETESVQETEAPKVPTAEELAETAKEIDTKAQANVNNEEGK